MRSGATAAPGTMKGDSVNRTQTALASLVAALPAALLATVLVMVILNYGVSGLMLQVLVFGTLAVTLPVGLLPALIFVFWGRQRAAAGGEQSETIAVADDEVSIGDESVEVSEADDTEIAETVDFDTGSLPEEALEAVEVEPATDEVDDALFLDEEEEPPKKKKKK